MFCSADKSLVNKKVRRYPNIGVLDICAVYRLPKSSTAQFIGIIQKSLIYVTHSKCFVMDHINMGTQKYDERLYV